MELCLSQNRGEIKSTRKDKITFKIQFLFSTIIHVAKICIMVYVFSINIMNIW